MKNRIAEKQHQKGHQINENANLLCSVVDGRTVEMVEDYYLSANQRLITRFKVANLNDILSIGDQTNGYTYVPKRNILYIFTGEVTYAKNQGETI